MSGEHLATALAQARRVAPRQDVALWLLDLGDPTCQACVTALSDVERERVGRLVFDRDRRRMAAARGTLKVLLGAWVGQAPSQLRLSARDGGKPWMPDHPGVFFNLSHSQDRALIAVTHVGEVGVDLEVLRPEPGLPALAERVFTPSEQAELLSDGDAADPVQRFFRGWTRKEACLKAAGWGLALDPQAFEVGTGEEPRRIRLAHGSQRSDLDLMSLSLTPLVAAAVAVQC